MNYKNSNTTPTKTVLVITVGFLLLFVITKSNWALYISICVGIAGASSSYLASKITYWWAKLAWILSLIVPNIVMSGIFYLLLTPIALLSRIFGEKNQLNLKNTAPSLFKTYNKNFDKASFEKPW